MDKAEYISQLGQFLESFSAYESQMTRYRLEKEKGQLGTFLKAFHTLDNSLSHFRKREASQYNLFEILHVRHLEARVHTPMIGNLLSPDGTHNQGALFLNSFFDSVIGRPDLLADLRYLHVIEELGTEKGFLDLIIKGWNEEGPFAVVIENKIYAGDQEKQLERYHDFLAKRLHLPPQKYVLIYLTLDGGEPKIPKSISQELFDKIIGKQLLLKSYRKDIRPWLETLVPTVEAPKVTYSLLQYIQILSRV